MKAGSKFLVQRLTPAAATNSGSMVSSLFQIRLPAFSRTTSASRAKRWILPSLRDPVPYLGRPWSEVVIYELHVGTFSQEGTSAGVAKRLDYLRDFGITAIELMPLNDVPGRHTGATTEFCSIRRMRGSADPKT